MSLFSGVKELQYQHRALKCFLAMRHCSRKLFWGLARIRLSRGLFEIRATPHLFFVFAFLYTLTYLVTPGAQRAVASKPASANIHVGSITITTRPCTTGLMYVKSSVSILPLKNHTFTLDAFLPRHGCLSYA